MDRRSVEDALARHLEVPAHPARIVSLVPSVTELLFDLGAGDRVVGVSRYCTEPAGALDGKARVGGQKDPDLDAIDRLGPDLVIAICEENLERDVARLDAAGIATYVGDVRSVEDALGLVGELGDLIDAEPARVASLLAQIRRGVDEARRIATTHAPPRTFCPVWRDPWIAPSSDTYLHDVLVTVGARPLDVRRLPSTREARDRRYPKVFLDEVAAERPQLVLLCDEPFPFADRDAAELARHLPDARIERCDGKLLQWYGRRTGELARLAARVSDG